MQTENKPIGKREEFENHVNAIIEWINANYDPHTTIIINSNSAELLRGEIAIDKK